MSNQLFKVTWSTNILQKSLSSEWSDWPIGINISESGVISNNKRLQYFAAHYSPAPSPLNTSGSIKHSSTRSCTITKPNNTRQIRLTLHLYHPDWRRSDSGLLICIDNLPSHEQQLQRSLRVHPASQSAPTRWLLSINRLLTNTLLSLLGKAKTSAVQRLLCFTQLLTQLCQDMLSDTVCCTLLNPRGEAIRWTGSSK